MAKTGRTPFPTPGQGVHCFRMTTTGTTWAGYYLYHIAHIIADAMQVAAGACALLAYTQIVGLG